MGVPKRRQSKSHKNKRRAVWLRIAAPTLLECPQCHELRAPHRVCANCGFYNGKEVIAVSE